MAMDVLAVFTLSLLILGALTAVYGVDSRPGLNENRRNI